MAIAIAILAAGKGTRLKSKRPKVLHTVGGKPLLLHVIDAALQAASAKDIYVITGHEAEKVRAAVEHTGVQFIKQGEQKGTGHAVQQALPAFAAMSTCWFCPAMCPCSRAAPCRRCVTSICASKPP